MTKTLLTLALFTLSSLSSTLSVTGTVVLDNQKMIGARYMGYVKIGIEYQNADK